MKSERMPGRTSAALEPILSAHLAAHALGARSAAAGFACASLPLVYHLLLQENMHSPEDWLQDSTIDAVLTVLKQAAHYCRDSTETDPITLALLAIARAKLAERQRHHKRRARRRAAHRGASSRFFPPCRRAWDR
jgi:hypothetical protein